MWPNFVVLLLIQSISPGLHGVSAIEAPGLTLNNSEPPPNLPTIPPPNLPTLPPPIAIENTLDGKVGGLRNWNIGSLSDLFDKLNIRRVPSVEEFNSMVNLENPPAAGVDISQYEDLQVSEGLVNGLLNCECGRPKGRIVGLHKEAARINDIPWTAALVNKDSSFQRPFCGAALINDRYLLTAGHCVRSIKAPKLQVWLNDDDLLISDASSGNRLVYDVEEIKLHPEYKGYYKDIALIKLNDTVNLGSSELALVNPVCIPVNNDDDFSMRNGTVAGWGRTSEGGDVSSALLKLSVPIMTNEKCIKESKMGAAIKDSMMCAGLMEGGADACQGDSGGPLIVERMEGTNSRSILAGIVSWGFGCGGPRAPGVYTRVGYFPAWILENTKDAAWCRSETSND